MADPDEFFQRVVRERSAVALGGLLESLGGVGVVQLPYAAVFEQSFRI